MTQLSSMPHCIPVTVLSSFSLSLSLLSPVASLTQLVNTDAGLCGHDGKCQLEKTRPACIWRLSPVPSAELTVCTALKRSSSTLHSNSEEKVTGRQTGSELQPVALYEKIHIKTNKYKKTVYSASCFGSLSLLVLSYSPTVINMFH